MYLDTERLAQKLYDGSLTAKEVSLSSIRKMLFKATPGHETIDEPEQYRWFLIEKFPIIDFEITLKEMMEESGEFASQEKWQHDRIVELLQSGAPEWPAFATASGIIVDGYHRIAAHRTLKDRHMGIVVAVRRPGRDEGTWDTFWNESYALHG